MTEWQSLTTQERIALVQAHWTTQGSALAIALSIGMGVTRNVVMGVYTRCPSLKLTHPLGGNIGKVIGGARKASQAEPMRARQTIAANVYKTPPTPRLVYSAPARAPEFLGISLLELESAKCKWPSAEWPFTFCGQDTPNSGAPYCRHHKRLSPARERAR